MSQFDKDIKDGDLILAYHSGVHRAHKVERRFRSKDDHYVKSGAYPEGEYMALIHYETVLTGSGKKVKKQNCCDAGFCTKLTPEVVAKLRADDLKAINARYDAMEKILKA